MCALQKNQKPKTINTNVYDAITQCTCAFLCRDAAHSTRTRSHTCLKYFFFHFSIVAHIFSNTLVKFNPFHCLYTFQKFVTKLSRCCEQFMCLIDTAAAAFTTSARQKQLHRCVKTKRTKISTQKKVCFVCARFAGSYSVIIII